MTLGFGQPASAAPLGGCPSPSSGFELISEESFLQLQLQLGLPAARVPALLAFLDATDRNGDNRVCARDLPDTPGTSVFARVVVDNTGSAQRAS